MVPFPQSCTSAFRILDHQDLNHPNYLKEKINANALLDKANKVDWKAHARSSPSGGSSLAIYPQPRYLLAFYEA